MHPWNEDRLREDSDLEDDPPPMRPAYAASPAPARRRSSSVAGGGSPSSMVSSPSAGKSTRRRSFASYHGRAGGSRADAAHLAEEARAAAAAAVSAAADQEKLEREAPIRGLAKQMSRMDMFSGKKGGNGNCTGVPNHARTNSGMSFLIPSGHGHSRGASRIDDGALSAATSTTSIAPGGMSPGSRRATTAPAGGGAGGPASASAAAAAAAAAAAGAVDPTSAGGSGQRQQASRPSSNSPRQLEEGGGSLGFSPGSPPLAASGELRPSTSARGAAASRPSAGGVPYPETPPPLRGIEGRGSLVSREAVEDDPKEQIEPELMIGEIQSIHLNDEIVLVRKALVVIVLSLVIAVLVRELAGPLDDEVNILEVVCFVSILLLSFPVIRFTARLFAYIITTRASALLYRGNRYYFVVALHYDIAITTWSILSVVVWQQLFHRWVYTGDPGTDHTSLSRSIFRHGNSLLQCHLALRVGILFKNFLVLLVATSYLWRPYLQRVQSSILAQYILLLLTDYCTKGYCNPGDQRFAIEMGRQGIQDGKNISLYAVSKAMGFIPRNKLGHSFFRQLAGSDTLDSSRDATTLGNFLFDQLILRSCSPRKRSPPFSSPQRRSLAATLAGATVANSIRSTRSGQGGVYRALPRFGGQMQKRKSESSAGGTVAAAAAAAEAAAATCPRSPTSARLRSSMSDVGRSSGGGGPSHTAGGGRFGATAGAAPPGRGSGRVSSALGKLLPMTERGGFAPVSMGAGDGGGNGSGSEVVAGPLSRTGRGERGGGGVTVTSSPGRNGASERGAGAQEGASGLAVVVDESRQGAGSGKASSPPGGIAEVGAHADGVGRGDGTEGRGSQPPSVSGASKPPESASKEQAQAHSRDKSAFTGSIRSVASSGNLSDKDGGPAVADDDGEGRRRDQEGVGAVKGTPESSSAEGKKGVERNEDDEEEEKEEEEEEEKLVRKTLCPALEPELLDVAFKIFDHDGSGTVTKEEMVLGVVGTFKDHRSLAHTLQDSEHIARKLGLIFMWVILFILFFVWLSIWGADVLSLSLTFSSFLIAFSFMIGTAASNLMSAVLFIFVSRLYDVGDRVHIYNSSTTKGEEPTNVTVVKVDLMTTVFKRWDEQVFYMPNHLLAAKTIVNIQRTAHQWHEFMIQVAADTPAEKLAALQTSLQAFSKSKDKPEGLYARMGFSLTSIEDSTKLTIRITFRQRGNWQNMDKKWACQSMCTWAIKNACDKIGISYALPEVPLRMKNKLL
eukprot:g15621.t1